MAGKQTGNRTPEMTLYYFLIFASIEVILAFSWLGFIDIAPISITTLHIPVLLYALRGGPWAGASLGAFFGLLSMWNGTGTVFSPVTSGDPWGSLCMSLGARILFGFFAGMLYTVAKKRARAVWLWISGATLLSMGIHSALVFLCMDYFFPQQGIDLWTGFGPSMRLNHGVSYGLAWLVVILFYAGLQYTAFGRRVAKNVEQLGVMFFSAGNMGRFFVFLGIMFVVELALAAHFINRILRLVAGNPAGFSFLLRGHVISWGLQFCAGVAALSFLIFLVLIYFRTSFLDTEKRAQQDSLTKLYHKAAMAKKVRHVLQQKRFQNRGAFVMLDLDHFKNINDRFGHPRGDEVLCQVAACLQDILWSRPLCARLGGDEFCLYLPGAIHDAVLEKLLQDLMRSIQGIKLPDGSFLGSSFGIAIHREQVSFSQLYREADQALYEAKNRGRGSLYFYQEGMM